MKRFWDAARAEPAEGGWIVALDGRPMRVPGGAALTVPGRALAEALAAEWDAAGGAKGGEVSIAALPLTSLASTAQERIRPDPGPTIDGLARYGESDLLCYRDEPGALARRQDAAWQPWLDWAAAELGARLRVTAGIMPVTQDGAALAALRAAVAACGPAILAGLGVIVPALGSLVLGLAVAHGRLSAPEAHELALLDETWQAGLWGEDAEAAERRRRLLAEVTDAARFMRLASETDAP